MGRPACVSDADASRNRAAIPQALGEAGEFPFGFGARQVAFGINNGNAGAVVSADTPGAKANP